MTSTQKRLRELRERQSKERQRMAELSIIDDLSDEQRSELDEVEKGTPDLERSIRAATVAVEDEEKASETTKANEPDAELRERRELRSKASLTEFLLARMQGRMVQGPEAELAAAAETRDGAIPIELWDTPETIDPERRQTDTVSAAPGTVGVNLDRIRPAVFANSIAMRLGVEMPRVQSGTFASATISTSLTATAEAKSGRADASAAAFTVTSVTPKRISARLAIAVEDVAAVGQANFESILRENLSLVLSDELDDQMINGNGTAPNLTGIFERLTGPGATAIADFDAYAAAHAGGVDGLWANTIKGVSIVVGPATYQHASQTFQTATNYKGEISAAAYAMKNTGGLWTNKRMPDAVSNVQQAILYRMGKSTMNMMMNGGVGAMRTAVCPH